MYFKEAAVHLLGRQDFSGEIVKQSGYYYYYYYCAAPCCLDVLCVLYLNTIWWWACPSYDK